MRSRPTSKVSDAAPLFAALGDETRLHVVAKLCAGGPMSIARLAEGSRVSRQAITKHLHALSDVGLVRSQRAGRERIWELRTRRLTEVRGYLEQISRQWDEVIGRLQSFVEKEQEQE